jgi:hypothetical protein
MRRQYRPALRVPSLKSVAQDQPADDGLVFLFAPSTMRELSCIADGQPRRPVASLVAIDAMEAMEAS